MSITGATTSSATIPTTGTTTPSATASAAATASGLGTTVSEGEFLQLLVAQLKAQDPLQPTDSTQFVSQLAQFSQLEQTATTNSTLQTIADSQQASQRSDMTKLIGHNVTANASTLTLAPANGAAPNLLVNLPATAANVQVVVSNAAGVAVRTINMGPQLAGNVNTAWGGTDDHGAQLPAGTYTVAVTATDANKNAITGTPEVSGLVSSLQFASSGSMLQLGSAIVSPSNVTNVNN